MLGDLQAERAIKTWIRLFLLACHNGHGNVLIQAWWQQRGDIFQVATVARGNTPWVKPKNSCFIKEFV
jgi:hypothetical protein